LAPVEYLTEGGLLVTDRRHDRAVPNGNPPSTVGANLTHPGRNVMWDANRPAPIEAQAWDGWPVDWEVPPYNSGFDGYGFLPEWAQSPEPSLFESWPAFLLGAVNSLLLRGEVITCVTGRYANGQIARFITLNPDQVDVEFIDGRQVFTLAGEELPDGDVLLTRYQRIDGRLRGIGPLEWAAQSLVTAAALERQAASLADRGGVPWAVLKGQANINAQQAQEAQGRWIAASARRDGAPAVLGNGWDLETLTFSPKDMALLELSEFSERRICAAFKVPAYLVNVEMTGGMTYANAQTLRDQHWASCLRPIANLLAQSWSRWLLPRGSRLEFNSDEYTRPDISARSQIWATLHGIQDPVSGQRVVSVDEIRSAERLTPLTGPVVGDPGQLQELTGS
jgi:HK97 family phage portal protein